MKIRRMLVNEYTVGGSLLLIGAGFFSTRFTEALGYKLFSIPSMIPIIGGMEVTVGRVAALVPLSLGTAFLLRTVRPVTDRIPIVDKVADIADEIVGEVSKPVASEVKGAEFCASCDDKEMEAETVDHINPTEVTSDSESFEAEEPEVLAAEGGKKMAWKDAVAAARKELGITGFAAIKKGTPLYKRAKQLSA